MVTLCVSVCMYRDFLGNLSVLSSLQLSFVVGNKAVIFQSLLRGKVKLGKHINSLLFFPLPSLSESIGLKA